MKAAQTNIISTKIETAIRETRSRAPEQRGVGFIRDRRVNKNSPQTLVVNVANLMGLTISDYIEAFDKGLQDDAAFAARGRELLAQWDHALARLRDQELGIQHGSI